ncbi:MAG: C39 family peptidase [bacterium]
MKLGNSFLVLLVLLAMVLSPFPPIMGKDISASTEGIAGVSATPFVGNEDVSPQSMDSSVDFNFLKVVSYLWSDGHGDMSFEHIIKNNSVSNFKEITWLLDDWNTTDYRNIRAEDDGGPLVTSTRMAGTNIYITTYFRQAVSVGQSIHFTLFVTVGAMATGSGDSWNGHWYVRVEDSTIGELIQGVTLPSNAQIVSVSPTPTTQRNNYVEWRYTNVSAGWKLTIDLNYQLSSTMDVPLFYQGTTPVDGIDPVWELDSYGNPTNSGLTINSHGCYMTSAAMIINYWAERQGISFRTDPRKLNYWLRTYGGYNLGNLVNHSSLNTYVREKGINLSIDSKNSVWGRNDAKLDEYLVSGKPVIIGVTGIYGKHWVVATGKTVVDGTSTYTINDPVYGNTTVKERYHNTYADITLFNDYAVDARSLVISAHSPVEFVVTDSLGRKSGYDPVIGVVWDQIPNAVYYTRELGPNGPGVSLHSKELDISSPLDGEYTITVIGTGNGNYKLDVYSSNWQGNVERQVFSGVASSGSRAVVGVEYSSHTGLSYNFYLPLVTKHRR